MTAAALSCNNSAKLRASIKGVDIDADNRVPEDSDHGDEGITLMKNHLARLPASVCSG